MTRLPSPPQPARSALLQNLRFRIDPYAFLDNVRAECGDVFRLRLFGLRNAVFIFSGEALEQLFRMPEDRVVTGEIRGPLVGHVLGKRAGMWLDGEAYAARRRVMTPHFTLRGVARHTATIRRITERSIARWRPGKVFPLMPEFYDVANEAIARIVFGSTAPERFDRLLRLTDRFIAAFRKPAVNNRALHWNLGRWSPWGSFLAKRQELVDALDAEMRARERGAAPEADDVLASLMAAGLDEDEEIARECVVDETTELLFGGAESVTKVMAWTCLGVLSHPPVLERLRRELDEVLGERPIESVALSELPYLDAVINEGLRYQPFNPIGSPRLAKQAIELGGYSIAPGSVLISAPSLGFSRDLFPNPGAFDPGNFLGRGVKLRDWYPFGGGIRVCLGAQLAMLELAVVVATLFQQTELELGPGSTRPALSGMSFQPKNGLKVRFRGRRAR